MVHYLFYAAGAPLYFLLYLSDFSHDLMDEFIIFGRCASL